MCCPSVHDIKFVTENAKKKKKSSEVIPSQIVECNLPKNIYRCNFCDKEFPRQDSLAHWNTKHLSTSISLLTYTDTLTMSNVKVSNLFSSVGQCTTCLHYLGSSSNTQLVSTVKEHNASDHTKVIVPNRAHFQTILEQQTPIPTTPASYGSEGYFCALCNHRTSSQVYLQPLEQCAQDRHCPAGGEMREDQHQGRLLHHLPSHREVPGLKLRTILRSNDQTPSSQACWKRALQEAAWVRGYV